MKLAVIIPDWIRTSNLRLRRPTLYPVELRGLLTLRLMLETTYVCFRGNLALNLALNLASLDCQDVEFIRSI